MKPVFFKGQILLMESVVINTDLHSIMITIHTNIHLQLLKLTTNHLSQGLLREYISIMQNWQELLE